MLVLSCIVAGRRVAIPAAAIRSVIEIETITVIPRAPDWVVGLTALRSQALTVVDCAASIGVATPVTADAARGRRAAVIEVKGHLFALLVDEASDVTAATDVPRPVPGGFGQAWQDAADGLLETGDGPALSLDIERLVSGPRAAAA